MFLHRTLAANRLRTCDGESSSDSSAVYSDDNEHPEEEEETSISDELTQVC